MRVSEMLGCPEPVRCLGRLALPVVSTVRRRFDGSLLVVREGLELGATGGRSLQVVLSETAFLLSSGSGTGWGRLDAERVAPALRYGREEEEHAPSARTLSKYIRQVGQNKRNVKLGITDAMVEQA